MPEITRHAKNRLKQRMGIKKKSAGKNAATALTKGLTHSETTGGLHRYIDALYLQEHTANNIRIYSEHVYLFQGEKLITVFPLPNKYKTVAAKLLARKQDAAANSQTESRTEKNPPKTKTNNKKTTRKEH